MIDLFSVMGEVRLARWVRRAQQGDREAFRRLYSALHPVVFRYVARRVARPEDAEDLVGQLFWRLLDGLGGIDPEGGVRAYVLTAARRLVIDHLRARSHREAVEVDPQLPDAGPDPLARLERVERVMAVRAALAALSPEKRELLLLRYDSGLRYAEIARVLGTTEVAVRQRVSRALRELRASMGGAAEPAQEVSS